MSEPALQEPPATIGGRRTDRRTADRYPFPPASVMRLYVPCADETLVARILDVSTTGLGLAVAEPFEVGGDLVIQFRIPDTQRVLSLLGYVVHCRATDSGWRVGCAFARPLSADVLGVLLAP